MNARKRIDQMDDLFISKIWSVVARDLGGSRIVSTQALDGSWLKEIFDQETGVDYVMLGDKAPKLLAVRVSLQDYETFTIRNTTDYGTAWSELEKRGYAVENNCVVPNLVVQVIYTQDKVKAMAVAEGDRFYRFIADMNHKKMIVGNRHDYLPYIGRGADDQTFVAIDWNAAKYRWKLPVEIYRYAK